MKIKSLSDRVLNSTVKTWAMHCHKDPNYNWTKHDANALLMLENEIKRIRKERYLKRKAIEVNPYLDKDQPYHTT